MSEQGRRRAELESKALDIERRSMEIIEREIGEHGYSEDEWIVVRRVIHATADFDFARSCAIIFHPDAISSAIQAIASRCSIVGDSDIVLAGLNRKSLSEFGIRAVCHISGARVASEAARLNKTRAETAMRLASEQMHNGMVVVGNAPTALYEVIRMTGEGIRPALVIGVPVGFVSAVESKEALLSVDVPYITNRGRKGGSVAAAAIINALFGIYRSKLKA